MIWEQRWDTQQRMVLRGEDKARKGLVGVNVRKKLAMLWAGRAGRHAACSRRSANIMGLHDYHLPDMDQVAETAAPFYNNHLRGGEGHMEVGKLILNVAKQEGDDDAVGEAVRLHAVVGRLRRRAVDDHREVQQYAVLAPGSTYCSFGDVGGSREEGQAPGWRQSAPKRWGNLAGGTSSNRQ